jgi:predicted NUDIX family phosphoesterase
LKIQRAKGVETVKQDEMVLSIKTRDLPTESLEEGFNISGIDKVAKSLEQSFYFAPRGKAEYDFEAKQIIPYVVLMSGSTVLLVRRFRTQSETRLHDKYSIGLGGHINPEGESFGDIIKNGIARELNEELIVEEIPKYTLAGILNDNTAEVSKVHLGLVYIAKVDACKVQIREKDKMKGEFVPVSRLNDYLSKMESWSQILIENDFFAAYCK